MRCVDVGLVIAKTDVCLPGINLKSEINNLYVCRVGSVVFVSVYKIKMWINVK